MIESVAARFRRLHDLPRGVERVGCRTELVGGNFILLARRDFPQSLLDKVRLARPKQDRNTEGPTVRTAAHDLLGAQLRASVDGERNGGIGFRVRSLLFPVEDRVG